MIKMPSKALLATPWKPLASWFHQADGASAKREVRTEWCKEEFKHVLAEKSYAESYSVVNEQLGEYMTLGTLIKSYGGWEWPPAVVGGKLHFLKATRMGGKWVTYDDWSNLIMVLKLTPIHKEIMTEKWARFTKFHNDANRQEELTDAQDAEAIANSGPEPKQETKKKGKSKAKAAKTPKTSPRKPDDPGDDNGDDDPSAGVAKRKSDQLKDLYKECAKLKVAYKSSTADASTLMKAFSEDPQYGWGKGNMQGDVALDAAAKIAINKFETEFVTQTWQDMQKSHDVDSLLAGLTSFKSKGPAVTKLTNLVAKLVRMQQGSMDQSR